MRTLHIKTADGSYPVYCGDLPSLEFSHKVLIVTNTRVGALYLPLLLDRLSAPQVYICTIEDGEVYKTMASVERILEVAFLHRLDRKSIMIALGGGVIGDMVGFASGIFMRGIDFIQIPTTLLAQVDASIGGKTGVNNAFGKNLIGVFHQPKAVYMDTSFLKTLPIREKRAGIAEIIKMAVAFDRDFFEWLEATDLDQEASVFEAMIQSVQIKQKVVENDEQEKGLRAALNYGHTFGHAIERENHYEHYLHGEAVSIGMVMANELAYSAGILPESQKDRVKQLLCKNHLPIHYQIKNIEHFYDSLFLDKKNVHNKITFILPQVLGNISFYDHFSRKEIMAVLEKFH